MDQNSALSGEGTSQTLCSQDAYKLVVVMRKLYKLLEYKVKYTKVL